MARTTYAITIETFEPFHLGWLEGAMGLPASFRPAAGDVISLAAYDDGHAMANESRLLFTSVMSDHQRRSEPVFRFRRSVTE